MEHPSHHVQPVELDDVAASPEGATARATPNEIHADFSSTVGYSADARSPSFSVVSADGHAASTDILTPRIGWRTWLGIVDALSLMVALGLVLVQVDVALVEHRVMATFLTVNSLYLWFAISQRRTLDTILRRTRPESFVVPVLASLITFGLLSLIDVFAPVFVFAQFTLVWVGLMIVGRGMLGRRLHPLRMLLIGTPGFAKELQGLSGVEVFCHTEPPQRFHGWDVVVTDPVVSYDAEWSQWMDHADLYGVKVLAAPLVLEALTRRVPFEMLNGRWAFQVLEGQSRYLAWKRFFDVAAIVLLSPLILLIAAIVALVVLIDSGRPILFWQERVGLRGKPFMMVKFRSMKADSELNGSAFATHADPRITKIGHFLRKFRLDEIPQLWNVLRGEMSIIGPRPEQRGFASQFADEIPLYDLRHNLRPGITGWAQVMQGYADDTLATKIKLRHDFYYVRRCSLALDFRIVLETLRTIVTGFGSR